MSLVTGMYNKYYDIDLKGFLEIVKAERFVNVASKMFPEYDISDFLPPPIYDLQFRIVRKENIDAEGNYQYKDVIPFWSLSSGERQVAYLISNIAYHLVNINSVHTNDKDMVDGLPLLKYKYVNIIFDEIELYFHPDLQRRFLSLLINALRNIHIDHIEGVNILLATHSPFVLSDIPQSNVLALSKDCQPKEIGGTFCANIQEMLGRNFFMEYSMGQIAQECVEEIFRKYNEAGDINRDELKRYKYIASIVSDEYLQSAVKRVLKIMGRNKGRGGVR